MATIKTGNGHGKYHDPSSLHDVITYIMNPKKAPNYYGGFQVSPLDPIEDMELLTARYGKTNGVQLRHFIISFAPDELREASVVNKIARMIVPYLGSRYQTVFAVHEDKPHLHIHIVCNAISYVDGKRYRGTRKEFYDLLSYCNGVLRRFGVGGVRCVLDCPLGFQSPPCGG